MKAALRYGLIIILTATWSFGFAQSEGTQYFMTSLPQVTINNPAFVPRYDFSIGVPGLSSVAVGYYNNGFSYNDLITKTNGEVVADLPKWVESLTEKNYVLQTANVDLLRVGFRINPQLYLQVSSTARSYARVLMPKGVASLFVDGTAPLIGTSTSFSPQAEGIGFVETGVSAAFEANEQLTLGGRLKYLSGVANATTVHSSMDVAVGNDYQLTAAAGMNVRTSGLQDGEFNFKNAASNSGFAIDLGANFKVNDKFSVAASIVDLGSITWKHDLYSYTLDKASAQYTFAGVDLKEVLAGNNDYLQSQQDSIKENFTPVESTMGSYQTRIPLRFFASGSYTLKKDLSVGVLYAGESFQERVAHAGTLSLSKHFGKWMSGVVSYTVSNRSYNNFGVGVSFDVKPVQIYFVGDNLLGIPPSLITRQNLNNYINSTQVFNLRFGINFVWGRNKSLDPQRNTEPYNDKPGSGKKEKVTSGDPSYLKVRKKKR